MNEQSKNNLTHQLHMQQKQGLIITPALAQALHVLTMPALELAEYVRAQVEENPALELGAEEGPDGDADAAAPDLVYDEEAYEESWQRYLSSTESGADLYGNASAPLAQGGLSSVLPAHEEQGLFSLLRLQLALREAPALLKEAAQQIIAHLDEDGYFSLPMAKLSKLCGYDEALLQQALTLVQSLEPAGVAARDLRECLSLQIGAEEPERELLLAVIAHHLQNVAKNRVRETARALKVGINQTERAFTRIRALQPKPAVGIEGGRQETQYIVPDIIVRKINGEYQVFLNENLEPRLHIGPYYRQLDPLARQQEEVREYLRRTLSAAHNLIRNIEKRRDTIYRLAQIVVERQRGFLDKGLAYLAPLTMKEAAEAAGLHESTVSRAVTGKYVQTPHGVYEWKFFFPRAYNSPKGKIAPAWAKAQLAGLIEQEDKANPYPDRRLQELLSERGIDLARRTVAKYREELGIGPRSMRRRG